MESKEGAYREADDDAAAESFRSAYKQSASLPEDLQIPGMQAFAAAIWDRTRHIPSQRTSTLDRIFDAFDRDRDGHLTAKEVSEALRSRGVQISEAQAQAFVEASDSDNNSTVERSEFDALVVHMASADLRNRQLIDQFWAKRECQPGQASCSISYADEKIANEQFSSLGQQPEFS